MSDWSVNYYRSRFPDELRKSVYDALYQSWASGSITADLGHLPKPLFDTTDVVRALSLDHPELFWVDYYKYTVITAPRGVSLHFRQFCTDSQRDALHQEAETWKKHVISQVPYCLSRTEKIWMLYDYLARQVTYGSTERFESYTIAGVFMRNCHTAVCEGIAKSCKYLCNALGIPCIIVCGNADGLHAWNIVQTENGLFRHLDITAELKNAKRRGMADRDSFLYTDRQLLTNGYSWTQTMVPRCK